MVKIRSYMAGFTDYTGVSLEDIIEHIQDWKQATQKTVKNLIGYKEQVITCRDRLHNPEDIENYIDYFIDLFQRYTNDFERLLRELPTGVEHRHLVIVKQLYKSCRIEEELCREFKREHIATSLKDESLRLVLLDRIYADTRSMIVDYYDLANVASRFEALLESPVDTTGKPMNLIARFKRLTPLNKIFVVGSIASIIALIITVTILIWPEKKTSQNIPMHGKAIDPQIQPDISCSMEYPIKVEDDKVFRNKRNPDIIVKNNGPIKVVSVSCDIKIYVYNAEEDRIINFIDVGFRGFDHALSAKELEPFDEIKQSTMGIDGKDLIAIYSVSVSYHRESDMEPFSLQEYFFTENRKIIEDREFQKDSRYNQIMEKVKSFDPSKVNHGEFMVTAAAEHTWFFESDPLSKVRKNPDGSITVATPKEQGEKPKGGYPFLEIKPHPFKATGFYTKARIVEDHIEVKIAVEVRNIGDTAAIITENGFDPTITIEPGQKKYYTRTQMVKREKGNQESLENFIKLLDTEDIVFRARLSFLYRPANDMNKLFKSTIHYGIGKNRVMPISE